MENGEVWFKLAFKSTVFNFFSSIQAPVVHGECHNTINNHSNVSLNS